MNGANQAVSGGIGGFLAFFLLACALWLLMRNMNKRLRNVKYDEELEQQRHAAEAGQETVTRPPRRDVGAGAAPGDDPGPPAGEPPGLTGLTGPSRPTATPPTPRALGERGQEVRGPGDLGTRRDAGPLPKAPARH